MHNPAFVAYLPDPFQMGRSAYGAYDPSSGFQMLEPAQMAELDRQVVTFDASAMIEDLVRVNARLPKTLIDITEALKLLSGTSKKDGGEKSWRHWSKLRACTDEKNKISLYRQAFEASIILAEDQVSSMLEAAVKALSKAWQNILLELEASNESERFFSLEVPVAQLFYHRQAEGISIDQRRLLAAHAASKREKYQAYVRVAEQTQVSPTGMNFRNVERYVASTDAAYIGFASQFSSVEDYFRMAADFSSFARDFVLYIRADRDLKVLSRLLGSARAYPRFHPHGTVTSRVLVSDPYLQQLRRKYRDVIVADKGNGLAYLDFRQFEPGILAGLSDDAELLAAYNSKDLYTTLGEALFGMDAAPTSRDICKRLFLGFCYGMSKEHIATVVAGPGASRDQKSDMLGRVAEFFGRYEALDAFKTKTEQQLASDGFVMTLLGNRRYRTKAGALSPDERRWAVSQTIQGNASLVFKEALLQLRQRFGDESILLPMHDAVLMQFAVGTVRQSASEAGELMKQAFANRFPKVKPKVSVERFAPA